MKKSVTIKHSHSVTLTLVMGGKEEKAPVLSVFGPVRAGLTTTQRTNEDRALTELLNTLEREVATLVSRSYAVLDTYLTGTTHLVEPKLSIAGTTGISL
jgi:hypothetical protein